MTVITHPGSIIISSSSSSSSSAVQINRPNYPSSAQDDSVQQVTTRAVRQLMALVTTDLMRNTTRRSRTIMARITPLFVL